MAYDYIQKTSESDVSKGVSSLKTPTSREIADRLNASRSKSSRSSSSKKTKNVISIGLTSDNKVVTPKTTSVVKRGSGKVTQSTYKVGGKTYFSENGKIVGVINKSGLYNRIRTNTPSTPKFNYYDVNPQSVDPKKLVSRTTTLLKDKNGNVWGYYDKSSRLSVGFSTPIKANDVYRLEQSRQPKIEEIKNTSKIKPITIEGFDYYPRTKKEEIYLNYVKNAIYRQGKFNKDFVNDLQKRGLNINTYDKWYTKALKGAGIGTRAIAGSGGYVGMFFDGLIVDVLQKRSVNSLKKEGFTDDFIQEKLRRKYKRKERLKSDVVPAVKGVIKDFNPVKPENWFNILTFGLSVVSSPKNLANQVRKFNKNYIPSTRNANNFKSLASKELDNLAKAKNVIKSDIKAGNDVVLNRRLLSKVNSVEKSLTKAYANVGKVLKGSNVLKLNDFNPLISANKIVSNLGKDGLLFHATGTKVKNILGKSYKVLKSESSIIKSVSKASGKARRGFTPKNKIESFLLSYVKKRRGVVSGGKAQNIFVKKVLTRKTIDYDILIKNNRQAAYNFLSLLKKKFPKDKFELKVLSKKDLNFKVYRIKVNGKDLVDFDPIPKDLGKTVIVDGVRVASPTFLAKRKVSTIGDVKKLYRQKKDTKDLKRLTGSFFNDKKLFSKVKNPKDAFTVRPQPKGMGASRIKFNENQMFFDLEIPTSYAYNAIGRPSLTQRAINLVGKVKLPKGLKAPGKVTNKLILGDFIKKINKYRYIKSNAKITVFKLEAKIGDLSPSLLRRVKNSAKLTAKQRDKLRVDINNYINNNINKVLGGSRTLSKGFGEREFVVSVNSRLFKQNIKKSFDPQTNTVIDVVEIAFKRANKASLLSSNSSRGNLFNRLRLASISDLKNNLFTPGDWLKVKKYQRALLRAEKLSKGDYDDIVTVTLKMLRNKKASKTFNKLKKKESEVLNILREAKRNKFIVVKRPTIRIAANLVLRRTRIPVARKSKRVFSRNTSRTRVKARVTPRVRSTSRTRVKARVTPRVRSTPRTRVKPRITGRSIIPTRTFNKLQRIRQFSLKRKKTKFSKDEVKYMLSKVYVKGKYRPSLAAIVFNITGFKAPKTLTGFEIRPVIKKSRK